VTNPKPNPGIAKVNDYNIKRIINHPFLKPKALNIPNSYVFSSTSPIISEYIKSIDNINSKKVADTTRLSIKLPSNKYYLIVVANVEDILTG
jgi:inhibitor of KinA sporulation pathway (predicted exonuclease)